MNSAGRQKRVLMVAMVALIAASIFPACGSICCSSPATASIHASMPCCNTQPKLERAEAMRVPPAVTASAPVQATIPVTITAVVQERAVIAVPGIEAHHQPSPPLFLRNAQLLI